MEVLFYKWYACFLLIQKLQKNYDALLLMYGEKAEEAEELKLDLLDVKAMYRSQVIILLHSIVAEGLWFCTMFKLVQ